VAASNSAKWEIRVSSGPSTSGRDDDKRRAVTYLGSDDWDVWVFEVESLLISRVKDLDSGLSVLGFL